MLAAQKVFPQDAVFEDKAFENIFLHGIYPGEKPGKGKAKPAAPAEKAEIWALYDKAPAYNSINLLRHLRTLWGIDTTLKLGPRSATNSSIRGFVQKPFGSKAIADVWFEAYQGNISDATRTAIAFSPYEDGEKSRALSQKAFIRFVVPLKKKSALEKIEALLMAYSVAAFLDPKHFAGIVDPDLFLFVPPTGVRAGLANYLSANRLLNTHLVTGFNFYEIEGVPVYFTHGFSRFGFADLLLSRAEKGRELTTGNYAEVLKLLHGIFLNSLTGKKNAHIFRLRALGKKAALPEQVAAITGKNIRELVL
ncbi:hypothetical protein [Turneriella parva]|uniref:Uncharacterized protein n=1 Tax=Turneriella parva (strain ATCC BAA-1111 / DSM 21527 / NCTC 11395 / H) TaxID=869212 RepID=I4B792_TURPD|nr:hypothetical protein [Turneriella parva]AFM13149.1 hypothetical protein Turpa_2509 [Turneriella parva DSM 21527]